MKQVESVSELRSAVAESSGVIAFVPTMGNLHQGHLALVREARKMADFVVVSIFVNPMQFSGGEDLDSYPRTMQRDRELLEAEGTDLLFAPDVTEIYPEDMPSHTKVEVPLISDVLCGASRPGHFTGVATVVCKLFNMVQPDIAVFGKKDYQQLMVIRRMVKDLDMPLRVVGLDTVREPDGLAMSSRNGYLSEQERELAPVIYRTLVSVADALKEDQTGFTELENSARETIADAGLRPDYFSIRRASDLSTPAEGEQQLVILAAAYLGKARLIDNLEIDLSVT